MLQPSSHRAFDSFGKLTSGTIDNSFPFGLNGMPWDVDTNLYQTDTVPYDPSTGRRLSEDWIGFASGTTNFTVWAGNNPLNMIDPSGMCNQLARDFSSILNAGSNFSNPTFTVNPFKTSQPISYDFGGSTDFLNPFSSIGLAPTNIADYHTSMSSPEMERLNKSDPMDPNYYTSFTHEQLGSTGAYLSKNENGNYFYNGNPVVSVKQIGDGSGPFDATAAKINKLAWNIPIVTFATGFVTALVPGSVPSYDVKTLENGKVISTIGAGRRS